MACIDNAIVPHAFGVQTQEIIVLGENDSALTCGQSEMLLIRGTEHLCVPGTQSVYAPTPKPIRDSRRYMLVGVEPSLLAL